jgi:hypothetical protein
LRSRHCRPQARMITEVPPVNKVALQKFFY